MGLFLIFVLMRFSLRLLINHNVQSPPEFVIVFHRPWGAGEGGGHHNWSPTVPSNWALADAFTGK